VMKSILSAVVYMHKLGIVHRDLKPENMLYVDKEPNSNLKLIDFGTARKIIPGKKLTKQIGTAYYIAPEVLAKSYDEKCDVWSCGIILYILLSGYPPFRGQTEKEIIEQVKFGNVSFEGSVDHNIRLGLDRGLKRCSGADKTHAGQKYSQTHHCLRCSQLQVDQ
jgi:calcium-dependent protein kinase